MEVPSQAGRAPVSVFYRDYHGPCLRPFNERGQLGQKVRVSSYCKNMVAVRYSGRQMFQGIVDEVFGVLRGPVNSYRCQRRMNGRLLCTRYTLTHHPYPRAAQYSSPEADDGFDDRVRRYRADTDSSLAFPLSTLFQAKAHSILRRLHTAYLQ